LTAVDIIVKDIDRRRYRKEDRDGPSAMLPRGLLPVGLLLTEPPMIALETPAIGAAV
jgi:hypothetical protein